MQILNKILKFSLSNNKILVTLVTIKKIFLINNSHWFQISNLFIPIIILIINRYKLYL